MNFFYIILFVIATWSNASKAIVLFDETIDKNSETVRISSYFDFEPIGFMDDGEYKSVFSTLVTTVNQNANLVNYEIDDQSKLENDVFIGCYSETEKFRGYDKIYPAVFTSPISIITRKGAKIQNIKELEKLRGGYDKTEPFSDYVSGEIKKYNPKEYEGYYNMFEALFNDEIDFAFSNYYYGVAQIAKIGIQKDVIISKQALWDVPVFICIYQQSKQHQKLLEFYQKYLREEKTKQTIKENLIKIINDIKIRYKGVSAPNFMREENK